MNKFCAVIAISMGFAANAQAVERNDIPFDSSMATWLTTNPAGNAPIVLGSEKEISRDSASKGTPYSMDTLSQMAVASNIVKTDTWANINMTISAPSREQWYVISVGNPPVPTGWNYEGYTYSLVLTGGYDGGIPDTSRVELVMCVNWDKPLQTCRTLRDDSDDYAVQHDAAIFSGFPVDITPNSQILYFVRVLEHVGAYQPYPYPTPVTITISSKLYLSN